MNCILAIAAAAALFCLVLLIWNAALMPGVERVSETPFDQPGHEDGTFDRQSISYDRETETFLFSGYMLDGTACPVYLMRDGEKLRRIELLNTDGTGLITHAGGIAVGGEYIYVAGGEDDCLYVYGREEVLSARDGESVKSVGTFSTAVSDDDGMRASFLTVDSGKLYVGEFYLPLLPIFKLRGAHHIGSTHALLAAFETDPEKPLGLSETPCEACALPDRVQGAAVDGSRVFLSRAFFLIPSEITAGTKTRAGSIRLMGEKVPLYTLEKTASVNLSPFGEEIELVDGRLYIATESPFMPRWFYRIWKGQKCRTLDVKEF